MGGLLLKLESLLQGQVGGWIYHGYRITGNGRKLLGHLAIG